MIVKDHGFAAALAKGTTRIVLLFGPDESQVDALAAQAAAQLGRDAEWLDLTGSECAKDPARLADEAASTSLFGDRRLIRVRNAGDDMAAALDELIARDAACAPVVIQAPGLTDRSKLAKAVAAASGALGCACWPLDTDRLIALVRELGDGAGLRLGRAEAERIAAAAGNDRAIAASEVAKLALYCDAAPERPATPPPEALDALLGEAEDDGFFVLVDTVLGGRCPDLAGVLARARQAGLSEVGLVLALQRRAALLGQLAARRGRTDPAAFVEAEVRARRVMFRDKGTMIRLLGRWRLPDLERLNARLIDTHRRLLADSTAAATVFAGEATQIARFAASRQG